MIRPEQIDHGLNDKQALTKTGVGDNEVCGVELEFAKLDDV
jgi:hypothetical protein